MGEYSQLAIMRTCPDFSGMVEEKRAHFLIRHYISFMEVSVAEFYKRKVVYTGKP